MRLLPVEIRSEKTEYKNIIVFILFLVSIFYIYCFSESPVASAAKVENNRFKTTTKCNLINLNKKKFSLKGQLMNKADNIGLTDKKIYLYQLKIKENNLIASTSTGENGYYLFSFHVSDSSLSFYRLHFLGDNRYHSCKSSFLVIDNLNKLFLLITYLIFLSLTVCIPLIFLLRKLSIKEYKEPLIVGLILGGFIAPLRGIISLIFAMIIGGLVGFMYAKKQQKTKEHIKFGLVILFAYLLLFGVLFWINFTEQPENFRINFTVTQMTILKIMILNTFDTMIRLIMSVIVGVVTGGYLRKHI